MLFISLILEIKLITETIIIILDNIIIVDNIIRDIKINPDHSTKNTDWTKQLEALPVDDGRSRFIILLLADPHLLECGQGCQDGPTDPYGVLPLGWCDNLNLHRGRCKSCNLFLHTISNTREHRGTAREHGVGVQILTDINIAFHDAVVCCLVKAAGFHSEEAGLEHGLWASESLVSDCDDLSVWELIALLEG